MGRLSGTFRDTHVDPPRELGEVESAAAPDPGKTTGHGSGTGGAREATGVVQESHIEREQSLCSRMAQVEARGDDAAYWSIILRCTAQCWVSVHTLQLGP